MLQFYIKEVLKSFKRAKLSFIISLFTTSVSVFLVTLSVLLIVTSTGLTERFNSKAVLNLFISDSLDEQGVAETREYIDSRPFTAQIHYINKDEARQRFLEQTGEDFADVLEYNPLPRSFELRLKPEYIRSDSLKYIARSLADIKGIDEVVFESGMIYKALEIISSIKFYVFLISAALVLISLYIVFATNRLIIQAKLRQFETMKLVGAKLSAIKLPVVLTGFFIGILASLLASGVFELLIFVLKGSVVMKLSLGVLPVYLTVFLSGPLIGLAGSLIASSNFSLKVNKFMF